MHGWSTSNAAPEPLHCNLQRCRALRAASSAAAGCRQPSHALATSLTLLQPQLAPPSNAMKLVSTTTGRGRAACGARRQSPAQAPRLGGCSPAALPGSKSWRTFSHNERLELAWSGGADVDVQAQAAVAGAAAGLEPAFDVLGLAQAMVDISAAVDHGTLAGLGVDKGSRRCAGEHGLDARPCPCKARAARRLRCPRSRPACHMLAHAHAHAARAVSRRLIGVEERGEVLAGLEGRDTAISAGGSLANTLLGLARLSAAGAARWGGAPLRVGMAGLLGADPLGEFFSAQVGRAGAWQPLLGLTCMAC